MSTVFLQFPRSLPALLSLMTTPGTRFANSIMRSTSFYGSSNAVLHVKFFDKLRRLKDMVSAKTTKLIVVSDFDHTLTKFTSPQCHDIVGFNERYTKEFLEEFRGIFRQPMGTLAEWWRVSHDLLVDKSGLTKSLLHEMLTSESVAVRDGLQEFVMNLRLNHVPLIIVSAGIRDVIAHTLANCDLPVQGDHLFHIDANYMDFHETGQLVAIYPVDPVHSESKQHVHLRAAHMFDFLTARTAPQQMEEDITVIPHAKGEEPELIIIEPMGEGEKYSQNKAISPMDLAPVRPAVSRSDGEKRNEAEEVDEEVLAIILGDRAPDFTIMDAHPWVHTLRVGFARSSVEAEAGDLFTAGKCDVVFVGEEHSLEAVHLLVDELIQLKRARLVRGRESSEQQAALL